LFGIKGKNETLMTSSIQILGPNRTLFQIRQGFEKFYKGVLKAVWLFCREKKVKYFQKVLEASKYT
jgi:hypothetical protein